MESKFGFKFLIFISMAMFGEFVLRADNICNCPKTKGQPTYICDAEHASPSCNQDEYCLSGRDGKYRCCKMKDVKNKIAYRTTCRPLPYCTTDSDCTKPGFGKCAVDVNGKINYCCKSYWPVNKENCEPDPILCTTSSDCPDGSKCVTGKDGKKYCCNGPMGANTCKPAAYCAVDGDCPSGFKHCVKGTGVNSGLNFCCKKSTSPLDKKNCTPDPKKGTCTLDSHCTDSGFGKCCGLDGSNKCCKTCDCGGGWQASCSCK